MNNVYIYGVPGTGKSTVAKTVARHLKYRFVELDDIRPIAQSKVNVSQEPFLYEYTTEAWRRFGSLNYENVVRGLTHIRDAFEPFIWDYLNGYRENAIAEAVFVKPQASSILIVNTNEDLHYSNFFVHRKHGEDADLQFKAARLMQDFLILEANEKGISVVQNDSTVENCVAQILGIFANQV